jgi:hypothetical protein
MSFELLKQKFKIERNNAHFILANLSLGAVSAIFAATVTYPTDIMKRKMQFLAFNDPTNIPYTNFISCAQYIYKTEGIRGFFTGLVPCYLKVIPSIAILFACNEELKKLLNIT